ncbi:DUF814 domain-containing protein [Candidatus Woesearchaeota archaeon]|nr:DUF814 domain-containing protein [Candidatus Woesearchaeota archaeon]
MRITLRVNESIEENAAHYFEAAKRAKKKLAGVEKVLEKQRKELAKLEEMKRTQIEIAVDASKEKEVRLARPSTWYHKYRWFVTSEGFLAVGGRDAVSNEVIIKKYTEPNDLVFHTDMAGSPFFVLKTGGKKPEAASLREVADATCTFSRAWKLGLGAQDVFYVNPDQVSKTAQSGEYLGRGAFMIRGKTTYIDNHINLAIGVDADGFIMAGPIEAISKHCEKAIKLVPGDKKSSDIAKQLAKLLDADHDEVLRALPAGGFKKIA